MILSDDYGRHVRQMLPFDLKVINITKQICWELRQNNRLFKKHEQSYREMVCMKTFSYIGVCVSCLLENVTNWPINWWKRISENAIWKICIFKEIFEQEFSNTFVIIQKAHFRCYQNHFWLLHIFWELLRNFFFGVNKILLH